MHIRGEDTQPLQALLRGFVLSSLLRASATTADAVPIDFGLYHPDWRGARTLTLRLLPHPLDALAPLL